MEPRSNQNKPINASTWLRIEKTQNVLINQRGSQSHLVNTKVYNAKFSLVDVRVNAKKYY